VSDAFVLWIILKKTDNLVWDQMAVFRIVIWADPNCENLTSIMWCKFVHILTERGKITSAILKYRGQFVLHWLEHCEMVWMDCISHIMRFLCLYVRHIYYTVQTCITVFLCMVFHALVLKGLYYKICLWGITAFQIRSCEFLFRSYNKSVSTWRQHWQFW